MENEPNNTTNPIEPPPAPAAYTAPIAPPPKKHAWIVIAIVSGVILLSIAGAGVYMWQKKADDRKAALAAQEAQKENDEQSTAAPTSALSGLQAKARDTQRKTDINIISSHLEAYFAQNGYYPSLSDLNNPGWRTTNMPGLDTESLVDPSSPNASAMLVAAPASGSYAYVPTDSSGEACKTAEAACTAYAVTATFEVEVNGSKAYTKRSLD